MTPEGADRLALSAPVFDGQQDGQTQKGRPPIERALAKQHSEPAAPPQKLATRVDISVRPRPTRHLFPVDAEYFQIARIERATWGVDLTDVEHDRPHD